MGKITIIGAGNGGCTYAAYLGKRGHEVCLYEVPELADNLKDVIELGGFEMRGCDTGFGAVAKCTTNIEEAVNGVEYILVVTPGVLPSHHRKAGGTIPEKWADSGAQSRIGVRRSGVP